MYAYGAMARGAAASAKDYEQAREEIEAKAAKKKAWEDFDKKYPNADKSKFDVQVIDGKGDVRLKNGPGFWTSVAGSVSKDWSKEMKDALGVGDVGGFPYQLSPSHGKDLPIPAVSFSDKAPYLKGIFEIDIYATPDRSFKTKFRDMFQNSLLTHTSGKEARKWLSGPNMGYWAQQLNFATWCATEGCGVSRDIFESPTLPAQVRAFYTFHVYFTIRRILYQMGGIQGVSALPGDPTFSQTNNRYDTASYRRLCNEFGVPPSTDFRYTHGANHGLGVAYIYATRIGPMKTTIAYPEDSRLADESGNANLIYYLKNKESEQYNWFAPNTADGLTRAGLSRINQSIEAFVYCVLGAQVNVRSSILGDGGRAKEAQSEFLALVEGSIRQPDLAKSVQRYQEAIDEAKVRLNLAVCPGAWLMPAHMVINTESTVHYNNQLKQATQDMKLGVNNEVNKGTKKVGVHYMDGVRPKIDQPNSHPSNPIHKTGGKTGSGAVDGTKEAPTQRADSGGTAHDTNKTVILIAAVCASAFLYALR